MPAQLDRLLIRLLGSVTLFDGLDRRNLVTLLSMMRRVEFRANALLFREGDDGDYLYVIVSGEVEIFRAMSGAAPVHLSVAGPGDCIGEMALIERAPRAASVRALSATTALELSRKTLSSRQEIEIVLYRNIARTLAQRLRRNNEALTALSIQAKAAAGAAPTAAPEAAPGAQAESSTPGKSPST